jgi:hypothetical protein
MDLIFYLTRSAPATDAVLNWMTCIEHEKENILFGIVP